MCREFVGNIEISRFLSGINLNLGPKMREFGRFSSGHTDNKPNSCLVDMRTGFSSYFSRFSGINIPFVEEIAFF